MKLKYKDSLISTTLRCIFLICTRCPCWLPVINAAYLQQLEHLKQEAENNARALQESIRKTEAHCQDLDKEISRLKSSSLVDKLSAEEQLQSAKQRIKAEEVRKRVGTVGMAIHSSWQERERRTVSVQLALHDNRCNKKEGQTVSVHQEMHQDREVRNGEREWVSAKQCI